MAKSLRFEGVGGGGVSDGGYADLGPAAAWQAEKHSKCNPERARAAVRCICVAPRGISSRSYFSDRMVRLYVHRARATARPRAGIAVHRHRDVGSNG